MTMAKLRGIKSIDRQFNRWLRKYGFKTRVRGADTDFFWYHDDTISYSFFSPVSAVENWNELLAELGCQYDIDVFFSSFLHELGHAHTYNDFTVEELDEYAEMNRLIIYEPSSFAESLDYVYTHLPVEYEATRWAVNYINQYPERVGELVEKVSKAVRRFYKIHKVVNEEMFA